MAYKRILLIDDDSDDQEIFTCALETAYSAIECIVMSSAKEALQELADGNIQTDLIFLDLNMPIMSGQQFLVEFRKEEAMKHIPVYILSTSSDGNTIRLTKELGADGFITKPETFAGLITVLKSVIT